jgi:hypothetical protein
MNTIKDLAKNWWLNLKEDECHNFRIKYPDFNIENIFYQEVILKWFQSHGLYQLCKTMAKDQIIAAYLEEHTKDNALAVEEVFNNPNLCASYFGGALEQPYFKGKGEHSVNELEKMCQQYKDYVSHINSQPKAIDNNVWDEAKKEYFKYVSECRLNGATYLDLFKWLEQFYSLIKK